MLFQRNIDAPLEEALAGASLDLFGQQKQVVTGVVGLYCQDKFSEVEFQEAKELYFMNVLGVSP